MRESVFTGEIRDSLKAIGMGVYKPGDMIRTGATRFIPEKPADLICDNAGIYLLIETKQIKKWAKISMLMMRDSQIRELDNVIARSELGQAWVFVNVRLSANKATGQKRESWLVAFDWRYDKHLLEEGIGSKELQKKEKGLWVKSTAGAEFDLRFLLDSGRMK